MKLVSTADYGIKGFNHYWTKRDFYNMTEVELNAAGVTNGNAYVDESLIPLLQQVNEVLKPQGYGIIVKDGYRSPELYKLIQTKRYEMFGKEQTDRILNTITMPHSNGRTVDVSLSDIKTGEEVPMRNKKDDPDNFFIDFYRHKEDSESKEYQRLQDLLIKTMLSVGFKLGTKNEFWHFEIPN